MTAKDHVRFANFLRQWLGLTLVLGLAACAPVIAPRGPDSIVPAIDGSGFLTRDGLRLPLRQWDAAHPRAIIVALHGMSDYSEAFDLPGPWWAERGVTTFAYDQRGFGLSPNRGLWAGEAAMETDLSDFVDAARTKYPGVPIIALGESMGGAVVLGSLAGPDPPKIAGAVLVAPAVWSRADMPASYRAALWLTVHTVPGLQLTANGLHIVATDNRAVLRKLSRDPLFQHSARVDQIYGLAKLMDSARLAPRQLSGQPPILFLYGAKDQVIPAASTNAVVNALGQRAEVKFYPGGYHMLLRDLEGPAVWNDILAWSEQRSALGP